MMFLTVFTPTYNRASFLVNLFNSLLCQTNQDFTWLIIDDGSTDNTKDLVEAFKERSSFNIEYYYQNNSGKHVATQSAINKITNEYFICVDSDDVLVNNAVQTIFNKCNEYISEDILGFYFKKYDKHGVDLSDKYPNGLRTVGITSLYLKYGFTGDTAIVLKTKYCKNAVWPTFENERFVTERFFYNQLNDIAPMVLCDETICICEYLSDGYTQNYDRLITENPYGHAIGILSDSIHSSSLIRQIKLYSEYVAIKKVYSLMNSILAPYDTTRAFIRFASLFLVPHYKRLYHLKLNKIIK